jgi:hypothetical protein
MYSTGCSGLRNATFKPDASLVVNPRQLAKHPQTNELDLPQRLRLYRLSGEPDLPANPRLVAHIELAEGVELQRESVRAQMIEQRDLQARDNCVSSRAENGRALTRAITQWYK